jgi:hypothetical protein
MCQSKVKNVRGNYVFSAGRNLTINSLHQKVNYSQNLLPP